jgi:DNA-binding GntR family transcriptional regulator
MASNPCTRVDRVFSELRADILAGRRRPGSKLLLAELVAHHEASMGVVREALSRLAAMGLVDNKPQHGFRVMPISLEDLRYLTEARCDIESLVLREALVHGSLAWESNVVSAHHRLTRTPQMAAEDPSRLNDEWASAHAQLHAALLDGCPNPRLRSIATALREAAELYRRWSVPIGHDQDRDIAGEHATLVRAAVERDAERAVTVLTEHIQHTARVLIDADADAPDSVTA